eukprot:Skav206642  [mRNA]  locus=scaffold5599:32144:35829:- [translate_table: standard]
MRGKEPLLRPRKVGPVSQVAGSRPSSTSDVGSVTFTSTDLTGEKESKPVRGDASFLSVWGPKLVQKCLEVFQLRSKSTARKDRFSIFPLPTSRDILASYCKTSPSFVVDWLLAVVLSLNSFWGEELHCDKICNPSQVTVLEGLVNEVKSFCEVPAVVPPLDWEEFLKTKTVDYKGDEVKVAQWFSWKNIYPALPADVGTVPLREVCTLGCQFYVDHFDEFIKPRSEWGHIPRARVMVEDSEWEAVCRGLVKTSVCKFILEEEVFQTDSGPLLNGMFGVTKDEFTSEGDEVFRLIMNLIPLNKLCRAITGDVDTLPSWSSMNPFFLQPSEALLVSSEDVKCFFYTMRVPEAWCKYLCFNKLVPDASLPPELQGNRVYLAATVLPMGFLNSVSLAQHVHRNLVSWGKNGDDASPCAINRPEAELRKDRPISVQNPAWRVYLDNYDLLEKVRSTDMVDMIGTQAPGILALRSEYECWSVPRNVKKSVERSPRCEVQGATIDGVRGVAYPREQKMGKYFGMALSLLELPSASQRQWQIVCGGLVYVAMFRRPLLGSLNAVWRHIESFNSSGHHRRVTPADCRIEVLRFLGMFPLARLNFRLPMSGMVTCSDASTSGGGICASEELTSLGHLVSTGCLRGEVPEPNDERVVLAVGLFDGIAALRVALELLEVTVAGYVSVETNPSARRVVEANYPGVLHYNDVREITEETVKELSCRFGQVNLVILGAGPPCQGVSGLNSDRRGALRDERSNLFVHVPRVRALFQKAFSWCPVHSLMESVASMDKADRDSMSEGFGSPPLMCDAGDLTWCSRPRLYWLSWDAFEAEGYSLSSSSSFDSILKLEGAQPLSEVIKTGFSTTSVPRSHAGRRPAGIHQCSLAELERWTLDEHRFPPYQYKECNSLQNRDGVFRLPSVEERELMLGFPLNYTQSCLPKSSRKTAQWTDERLTLLGNSWSVIVVACLLNLLFNFLGFSRLRTPQELLNACLPGFSVFAQGRLSRLPLNRLPVTSEGSTQLLASKLGNLVSVKGEDILLTTPTTALVKYHRLRASVPSKLWKWRIISGWSWKHGNEHINALELRAILASVRWRLEHMKQFNCRMIHLTDSLVCLHVLSRGRSSSLKLRRIVSKLNALILVGNVQLVWSYIHTDQNPADKPSRWCRGVRSKFRYAKKAPFRR